MTARDGAPLLEIDALNVSIGATHIIKNLSLELGAGEILGLVGASGSGKSMTALAVMQLLPESATMTGTVRLRGETLTGKIDAQMQRIRGRDVGMVFQEPMTALNPLMRIGDQVAETLRLEGAHVTVTDSAGSAFQHLQAAGMHFDILVTDIGMPEEDGFSLIRRVRVLPKQGRLQAIALTAYARTEDAVRAMGAGFQEHLAKPVDASDLIAAVERWTMGTRVKRVTRP